MKAMYPRNNDGASAIPISDRMPPMNLEAERGVLGSVLLQADVLDEVAAILQPEDFYRDSHQVAYRAMLGLYDQGTAIDANTLADELTRRDEFAKIGGDEALREFVDSVPHAANAKYYAQIVRERSVGRKLLEASTETARDIHSNLFTASELVCAAEERVFAISERHVTGQTCEACDTVGETMARMAIREGGDMLGTPCGYQDIDDLTSGFKGGEVTVLAARPGMGKTALAMDVAVNVATAGVGVMFVSIEMGKEALGDRLVSSQARINSYTFQRPWLLKPDEKRRIHDAANRIERLPVEFDFSAARTVTQIGACARRMKRRRGLGLVAIDYMQLVECHEDKGRSRQDEVTEISRAVKVMARNLGVPVLILSQLNRKCEERPDKRPMLADLRESGSIEQDADVVLLLYRGEYYDANDSPGIAEIIVAKNRNGATGTIKLAFVKSVTRFDSLARADERIDNGQPF